MFIFTNTYSHIIPLRFFPLILRLYISSCSFSLSPYLCSCPILFFFISASTSHSFYLSSSFSLCIHLCISPLIIFFLFLIFFPFLLWTPLPPLHLLLSFIPFRSSYVLFISNGLTHRLPPFVSSNSFYPFLSSFFEPTSSVYSYITPPSPFSYYSISSCYPTFICKNFPVSSIPHPLYSMLTSYELHKARSNQYLHSLTPLSGILKSPSNLLIPLLLIYILSSLLTSTLPLPRFLSRTLSYLPTSSTPLPPILRSFSFLYLNNSSTCPLLYTLISLPHPPLFSTPPPHPPLSPLSFPPAAVFANLCPVLYPPRRSLGGLNKAPRLCCKRCLICVLVFLRCFSSLRNVSSNCFPKGRLSVHLFIYLFVY